MHQIMINGLTVDVVRKDIKHLHLAVYPPEGRVRVAVPLLVTDDAVRLAVVTRLSWIKRQQAKFLEQERQSKRDYVSGESHYFQGRRYLLRVTYEDVPAKIIVRGTNRLEMIVRPGSDTLQRERVMLNWYRSHLRRVIPGMIEHWQSVLGVECSEWGIKHMKTKWGTCNIEAGRIWLNLELAKKSLLCLEYIVVHELVHLLERHHNDRFVAIMNQALPNWRYLRDELNREPLAHEDWTY
jgi:predicted metal-dependent hydrolase